MKSLCLVMLAVLLVAGLFGCEISKPYITKVDRTDQDLSVGNKGYLKGTPPPSKDRGELKRPFVTIDIELPRIQGNPTQATQIVRKGSVAKGEAPVVKEASAASEENIK